MKSTRNINIASLLLAGLLGLAGAAGAAGATGATGAAAAPDASVALAPGTADASVAAGHHAMRLHGMISGDHGHTLVSIGHSQTLPAGKHADNVVSVMGSSTVAGDVSEDVVTVLGNSRITGPVGGDVVAVLGNTYIDSEVDGDVLAVLGKVELGPNAKVEGDVNGGSVRRDSEEGAQDGVDIVTSGMDGFDFGWLQNWITNCALKGRLLAFLPGMGWAWTIALVSLALYVLTALPMPAASVATYRCSTNTRRNPPPPRSWRCWRRR